MPLSLQSFWRLQQLIVSFKVSIKLFIANQKTKKSQEILSVQYFMLVLIVVCTQKVKSDNIIDELKNNLFDQVQLSAFRQLQNGNLDENYLKSDKARAPRHYNTSKCIDDKETFCIPPRFPCSSLAHFYF